MKLDEMGTTAQESTSMFALLLQTIIALALIIAVIYFLLRFVSKRSNALFGRTGIRMLGGCLLGSQKSLQIVQIGTTLYIVGVGENVHLLRYIDDPDEVNELLDLLEVRGASASNPVFMGELVNRWFRKKAGTGEAFESMFQMKVKEARQRRESMEKELFNNGEKEKGEEK
ncbi:flagellar protein FliO/FliZ [Aneurinibacillus thermoaerophilus]|uniref:Flagellar protein FliO/FliZ n=1 Tax=Aneurinibacillus thermoaerophilus TaxID=143495 RepID=A0A1G7WEU2_ANETH|nr:flagellar biosynthetic protein FliO [Aneurinibacillus thermoaerophilus]SDG70517.1 flagellar protein FliO/FliZ [Aneurinibacillus thermoaerophilus]